jgi:hypothetical protein
VKGPPQAHHSQHELDERACRMICPIAAAMVGVCLTAIGILRVVIAMRRANTLADDMLALDAVLFLIATLTSYFALRNGPSKRLHALERVADFTFIVAMSLMTLVALVLTYALAI